MNYLVWASIGMGFLSMAASQAGCASSLDFDHVSSGRHGTDAGAHGADAGGVETTSRKAPEDPFGSSGAPSLHDAGGLGTSLPDAPGHSSHASSSAAAPSATAGSSAGSSFAAAGSTATVPAVDAGSSAPAVAADPAAFSCAKVSPKPYFCDDFESLALSSHWSDVEVYPTDPLPGGTIEIDGNAARAGHNSLLAEINEGLSACDNCLELRAALTLPSLQGPTKLSAEFDVRVEQIDPNEGRRIILFQLWWGTPEAGFTQHTMQLGSSGGNAWTGLVEIATDAQPTDSNEQPNQTSTDHQWQQTPVLSEWVHIVYALDVQDAIGTANVAKLTVGDVVLFDGPLSFALPTAKAEMEIGVPWVDMESFQAQDTSKRWRIRFDNVLVRYEPR
jgi:hypothetical protein